MKKLLTCVAMSTVLLSGCTLLHRNDGIVSVNNEIITKSQFETAFDKEINNSPMKNFGGASNVVKSEDNVLYVIFKDKVINELIVKTLLDNEIKKRGIKVTNDDMKNETKLIIDKVGSKEELNKMLKQRGVSNSEFMADLKTQIEIKKLISSVKKIKISDSDAEKYYKAHIKEFKHGEQVRASHILISCDNLQIIRNLKAKNKDITPEELNKKLEENTAEQKAKAEAILAEVKAHPEDFEKIAEKKSDDPGSKKRGGELGFFAKETMVPEFSKVAFAMKPDTISESVVKTPFGFHIIKVTDRIEAGTTPYAKVKDEIKFYLETQEQITVLRDLTSGLMKSADIKYLDEKYKPNSELTKKVMSKNKDTSKN